MSMGEEDRAEARQAQLLALARQVAADAAAQPDPDLCLRTLRAGLLRLGFSRAGIWLLSSDDPTRVHGTWGTDWRGGEVDEHGISAPIGTFAGSEQIVAGDQLVLRCVDAPRNNLPAPHEATVVPEGPPNAACVALRADSQLLGIISVDMLPGDDVIDDDHVAALLLLADQVAVAIARGHAVAALHEALGHLSGVKAELAKHAAEATALRELNQFKSEFLTTISHELRTPLTLLVGYSQLLATRPDRLDTDQVEQIGRRINTAASTLVHLVDDLLNFSRLERGELPVRTRPVDLVPVLREVVEAVRLMPGGERVVLEVPEVLPARADPERMGQVITNLLTNALRYAPEGAIVVRAKRTRREASVEVIDHGPGIPPEEQSRVWEKFYRGTGVAGLNVARGAGLGLSVVKALVEAQGGRVALESAPGHGSTFRVMLPAVE